MKLNLSIFRVLILAFAHNVKCQNTSNSILDDGPAHEDVKVDFPSEPNKTWPFEPDASKNPYNCDKKSFTHPDYNLDIEVIIKKYGYDLETHNVTTEDGYILKVFRIKGSLTNPARPGKVPVYLQHGIVGNCHTWIFLYGNNSLAFKLANAGYDVWLGNARGNQYSDKHTTMTNDKSNDAYWDFSFHEIGYYDVPAIIDYTLSVTGFKDLYYVGHSMGTTVYMIALSERPEYGKKIKVGFLLAVAGHVDHATTNIRILFTLIPPNHFSWKLTYGNAVVGKDLSKSLGGVCGTLAVDCGGCDNLGFLLLGFNPKQNNATITSYFGYRYIDITSAKLFAHFGQSYNFATFRRYDYLDPLLNRLQYGTDNAPDYPLEKITAPTVAFFGQSDEITTPADNSKTLKKFSPGIVKENNRVTIKSFNHLDMIIGQDVQKLVYDRILWLMDTGKYVEKKEW